MFNHCSDGGTSSWNFLLCHLPAISHILIFCVTKWQAYIVHSRYIPEYDLLFHDLSCKLSLVLFSTEHHFYLKFWLTIYANLDLDIYSRQIFFKIWSVCLSLQWRWLRVCVENLLNLHAKFTIEIFIHLCTLDSFSMLNHFSNKNGGDTNNCYFWKFL